MNCENINGLARPILEILARVDLDNLLIKMFFGPLPRWEMAGEMRSIKYSTWISDTFDISFSTSVNN